MKDTISKVRQIQLIIALAIGMIAIPLLLLTTLTADTAWAASPSIKQDQVEPALQATAVPTVTQQSTATLTTSSVLTSSSSYSLTFASLGYGETSLASPQGQTNFTFSFPEDWAATRDGQLNLVFSYYYNQVMGESLPSLFGDLTVRFDNQTLETFSINTRSLERQQLTIPIPASLLNSPNIRHVISVSFVANFLCELPHQARLIIHPTSTLTLNYRLLPLNLDLARYPRPFYQQSFTSSQTLFILPSAPTSQDFSRALAVAAKLGDLTGNRLAISTTTASRFQPATSREDNLIVIGQIENNPILSLLNETGNLPVSFHERQLAFTSQAPAAVAPGETVTYNFTVTNTLGRNIDLAMLDTVPVYAEVVGCTPDCDQNEPGVVLWETQSLDRDEAVTFSLDLKLPEALTGDVFENTVTLIEADQGPLNADTIISTIGTAGSEIQQVIADQEGYFFVYNGRAVAEDDGIVQEVVSPWNDRQAVLVITGLNDQAVEKASQAMSSEARLPGMKGDVALIKDVSLSEEEIEVSSTPNQMTLAELGYTDQILQGASIPAANYVFNVPFGWQLGRAAAIELYFSHSQLIGREGSALTVLLNRQPLASVALTEETANAGYIKISLTGANIRPGRNNQLTIQPTLAVTGSCLEGSTDQSWVVIDNRSTILLPHREAQTQFLSLANYPYPFEATRTLTDVLFSLPETPTDEEWVGALRIAAALGDSTSGTFIQPRGVLGADIPADDLANYHVIALGLPSRQPLIQEVNGQLPQPFIPGTNEIEQKLNSTIFRLPPGLSLGYLQLLASPWNEDRAFLAVTGTTDMAVTQAVNTLLTRALEPSNLALIKEEGIELVETRDLTESTPVTTTAEVSETMITTAAQPTLTPAPATPAARNNAPSNSTARSRFPIWLIPIIILSGLLVVGSLGFAYWQARRQTASS